MTHAQLRAFLAVLDAGSLSAAALDLDVAQSSVSRAVAELERDLGVRLLHRGRHGARATEAGERIALHARTVLELHHAIRQEAALAGGELRGRLRVAAFPSFVRQLVGELVVAFRERFPAVRLDLVEAEPAAVEAGVRDGRADVGFALLPSLDELIAFEVSRDRCVAVVPETWPADRVDARELRDAPFIMYDDPACERVILGYLERVVGPLEPAFRFHENATIVSMVARGLGVSIMSETTLRAGDGVRGVQLPVPFDRVTGAVVRPESLAVPTVKAFLALLRERSLIRPSASVAAEAASAAD